ncbi:MAG: hypothetical protein ACKOWF_00160, partial [Chloroflexota bacterium]
MDEAGLDLIARRLARLDRRTALLVLLGLAGPAAAPGAVARKKKPRRCRAGRKRCGKACVDLSANPGNCGACGRACGSGAACVAGRCCRVGEVNCGGVCRPSCAPDPPLTGPSRPFPQAVTYPGQAATLSHRTAEQQAGDVRAAYGRWKGNYLTRWGTDRDGHPLYWVVYNGAADQTVSEAMGFGMVIVALMAGHDPDARALFDGLWRFVREHPS